MAQQTRARRVSVILTLLLIVGLAAGCGGTKPEPAKTSPPAAQGQAAVLSAQPGEWKPDGVIADKEYAKMQQMGEIEVYSRPKTGTVFILYFPLNERRLRLLKAPRRARQPAPAAKQAKIE